MRHLSSVMYEFQLLEYFQTWIGILASLLVLCIALGTGNLHSQILEKTKEQIQESIKKAHELLESYIVSKDRSLDQSYAKIKGGRLRMDIQLLIVKRQQLINLSLADKPRIEAERSQTLKCIENRFITVTAPFFHWPPALFYSL